MVDATAGGGGHSKALLDATSEHANVRVLCIDRDAEALQVCARRLEDAGDRVFFARGKFSDLPKMLERPDIAEFLRGGGSGGASSGAIDKSGAGLVGGVLADLGVSTYQLENPERGFSCMSEREGPLDMRMSNAAAADGDGDDDDDGSVSAADLVNNLSEDQLMWIFQEYGGISYNDALKAARGIFDARPLTNTRQLANAISGRSRGPGGSSLGGNNNTFIRRRADGQMQRYFQALRIATNGELEELDALLSAVPPRLVDGGVFAVISFHSLEDARVKNVFRNLGKRSKEKERERQRRRRVHKKAAAGVAGGEGGLGAAEEDVFTLISRRAIKASAEEIELNKPSRSARLRVLQRGHVLGKKKGGEKKKKTKKTTKTTKKTKKTKTKTKNNNNNNKKK